MKRLAFALLGVIVAASAAGAAPFSSDTLRARFSGAEVRLSLSGSYHHYENHLWRFRSDGTVEGYLSYVRLISQGAHHVEKADTGRWQVVGDRICIDWQRFFPLNGNQVCFTVDEGTESYVLLTTDDGREWRARLHQWQPVR